MIIMCLCVLLFLVRSIFVYNYFISKHVNICKRFDTGIDLTETITMTRRGDYAGFWTFLGRMRLPFFNDAHSDFIQV